MFTVWGFVKSFMNRPPGDYETEVCDIRLKDKKYDEALKFCDTALEINPNYVYALSYKGKLLFLQKKFSESLKYYEKALKIEPDNQTAIFHKFKVEAELENEKKESLVKKFMKF